MAAIRSVKRDPRGPDGREEEEGREREGEKKGNLAGNLPPPPLLLLSVRFHSWEGVRLLSSARDVFPLTLLPRPSC